MKLTIFAATGGIGTHLLEQAVSAGHEVTAVARRPAGLTRDVPAVAADLSAPDPDALRTAVEGADAVLSALGPRSRADAGITSAGTRAITEAMGAAGVRRIVVVSAAPVSVTPSPGRPNPPRHDPGEGPLMRYVATPIVRRVFGRHYADLAVMEDLLRDSGLDWTAVRPPRLTDKPLSGAYRIDYDRNLRGGMMIARSDVAHLMLRAVEDPATIRRAVGIAD